MRIVSGKFRGRSLQAPKSQDIRPTTDRIRESLFNVISHNYGENLDNTRVLDLFAGTGALGIEALSRGARFALFIENSIEGRGLLRQNIENFSLQGHSKVFRRDATELGPIGSMTPFDLVFADSDKHQITTLLPVLDKIAHLKKLCLYDTAISKEEMAVFKIIKQ